MTARLPSLNGLRAFEAAARHLSFTAGGVRAERHADRDQPSDQAAGGRTRRSPVHPPEPLAGADAAGAGISPRHPRRLQRSQACDRPPAAQGRRPCADGLDAGLARRQMAAAAADRISGSPSRHRRAHHHLDQSGRFPARQCRCRDPLRPRPVAGPSRRLADGGRAVPGLQPGAAGGQQAAEMPRRPQGSRAAAHQQRQQRRLAAVADGRRICRPIFRNSRASPST